MFRETGLGEVPKMAEGTGLENQQVGQLARGFESLFLRCNKNLQKLQKSC